MAQLRTLEAVSGQRGEADHWIALVHVEIEHRESVATLRSRMFDYYEQLRKRYQKPVLPVGLYLNVGLNGVGIDVYEEHFWDFRPLRFEYLYVGLPGLNAETYVTTDNWLGIALAALMKIPEDRKAWLKAEAHRRLVQCPENPYRRFLLLDCVDTYLVLNQPQEQVFNDILGQEPYQEVRPMVMSVYEQMFRQERSQLEQRLEKERATFQETIQAQLEARFGPLSAKTKERFKSFSSEQLFQLGRALISAQSLQELNLE